MGIVERSLVLATWCWCVLGLEGCQVETWLFSGFVLNAIETPVGH